VTGIDLLKVVVWPVTIAGGAIVVSIAAMLIFRGAIQRFLDRADRWKLWKLGISGRPAAQAVEKMPREAALCIIYQNSSSPSVRTYEANIDLFLSNQKIQAAEDQHAALRRMLATAGVMLTFEQAASTMYQSQFQLLVMLSGTAGVQETNLTPVYEVAVRQFPELFTGYSMHGWLGYLEFKELIVRKSGFVSITDTGREFLAWLASTGRRIGPNG